MLLSTTVPSVRIFRRVGYLALDRQLRDPFIEFLQRLGLDQIGPADQGRVIGTAFRYTRQNCLSLRLSLTCRSVSS